MVLVVSIPNECLVWEFTWREESELVGVGMAAYESRPLGSSLAWDMYIKQGGSALDGVGDQKCKVLECEATIIQGMLQLLALRTIFEHSAGVRNVS